MEINTVTLLCILVFVLSIDYSLALISLQAYWIDTGGSHDLSGLVFGLYDGPTIIITPILAWLIDNRDLKYKTIFSSCIIANIIGNVIYATAYAANSWEMILIGRMVAGIGASCVPLVMCYVSDRVPTEEQQMVVGYIKYIAALSRSTGPIFGSIFSAFIETESIVNMYTLVGWIPVVMCIALLVLIYVWTEDTQLTSETWNISISELNVARSYFWPFWVIGGLSTFIYWFYVGSAFIIGTHYYHVVGSDEELGKLYYAGVGGYAMAFCVFFCFKKEVTSMQGIFILICFMSTVYLYLVQQNAMYYVAVGSTTFIYGLIIPSVSGLNNLLAKKLKTLLKGYFNITIIFLTICQAFARFAGPTLFTLIIHQNNDSDCDVDGENYETDGCKLTNYQTSTITINTIVCVVMLSSYYFFVKNFNKAPDSSLTTPITQMQGSPINHDLPTQENKTPQQLTQENQLQSPV